MVQEATMIVVDNTDFMRNGDFIPTRLQAQSDAVSLICQSKRQVHPENTVGLMTISKHEVLVTLTSDVSKVYTRMPLVQPFGDGSFVTAVRVAHLALRHRLSRNQKMRIVAFVGSPIPEDEKELVRLAKRLKKEKVSVDVINFGEDEVNQARLSAFVDAVNGKDGSGSHLVTVPSGAMLHDSLVSSPIILGDDGSGAVPGFGMEFGIDPNEDPELALALRVSLEDQRMRQEAEAQRQNAGTTGEAAGTESASQATALGQSTLPATGGTNEEAQLQQALNMSMAGGTNVPMDEMADLSSMTEDEQIAYALQMSLNQAEEIQKKENEAKKEENKGNNSNAEAVPMDTDDDVMCDPAFLQSVLETLPGVDPESDEVKSAMSSLTKKPDDKKK